MISSQLLYNLYGDKEVFFYFVVYVDGVGELLSSVGMIMFYIYPCFSSYPIDFSRGVMVKAMNCGIAVREFVLQSRYYVHFRANTLGKGMNPLILPPAMDK